MSITKNGALVEEKDVFADLTITQRDTDNVDPLQFSVTGTGSDILNPGTGYIQISEFENNIMENFTYDATTDELVFTQDGYYNAQGWLNFRHSANNSTIGVVFGFRTSDIGSFTYSQRPTSNKKPNLNDLGEISGGGQFYAVAGTRLSVHLASDSSGTITLPNANLRVWAQRLGAQ